MSKVKMQIDSTKPRLRHVWIVIWQQVEYENITRYCEYCTHHGHDIMNVNRK